MKDLQFLDLTSSYIAVPKLLGNKETVKGVLDPLSRSQWDSRWGRCRVAAVDRTKALEPGELGPKIATAPSLTKLHTVKAK